MIQYINHYLQMLHTPSSPNHLRGLLLSPRSPHVSSDNIGQQTSRTGAQSHTLEDPDLQDIVGLLQPQLVGPGGSRSRHRNKDYTGLT
jgi:hypothetical protein